MSEQLRVFRIDDGERHWYVARNMDEAKAEHLALMDPDERDGWTVEEVAPETEIVVSYDDPSDFPKPLPEGAVIEAGGDSWRHRCRATAAAWAATYDRTEQLCSSVF